MKLKDKTNVLFRKRASSFWVSKNGLIPSMVNEPELGWSSVPKICRRVVFPAPEEPTMDTISPLLTVKLMPFKIG